MILDNVNIKPAFAPVDLNTAAVTGARVDMKGCEKIAIVLNIGGSGAGGVIDVSLKQHDAASAGTSKALNISNPYHKKVGAATSFTKTDVAVAEDNFVLSTDFDTAAGVVVFEVHASDLDHTNGFCWISVDLADSAVAKVGSGIYILDENSLKPAYANAI